MRTRRRCLAVPAIVLVTLVQLGCPSTPSRPLNGWNFALFNQNTGDVISQNASGGYFVAGTAWIEGQFFQYVALTVGPNGVLKDAFSLPGVFSQARSGPDATALQATDGSLYFAGLTQYPSGPGSNEGRLRVVRTDPEGNVHWDYTYGDGHWVPRAIDENAGGEIMVLSLDWKASPPTTVVLKVDVNGRQIWVRRPLEGILLNPNRIAVMTDGAIRIVGSHRVDYEQDPAILLLDGDGEIVSYNTFSTVPTEEIWALAESIDGGTFLTGTTRSRTGKDRPYLLKVDRDGVFEWDRADIYEPEHAGSDVEIWDMVVDDEGYIAIVGDEEIVEYVPGVPLPVIRNNCFMMRLDAQGNLVWKKDFPGFLYALTATTQGTYMATGVTGTSKRYLIRLIELDKTGKVVN